MDLRRSIRYGMGPATTGPTDISYSDNNDSEVAMQESTLLKFLSTSGGRGTESVRDYMQPYAMLRRLGIWPTQVYVYKLRNPMLPFAGAMSIHHLHFNEYAAKFGVLCSFYATLRKSRCESALE